MTGAELHEWRRTLGLTQVEFAGTLGVTSNTVARWERDEVPLPPLLDAVLSARRDHHDAVQRLNALSEEVTALEEQLEHSKVVFFALEIRRKKRRRTTPPLVGRTGPSEEIRRIHKRLVTKYQTDRKRYSDALRDIKELVLAFRAVGKR